LGAAQLVQSPSTAAAVREAMTDTGSAAIAGRLASDLYGLPVLRERIQDHPDNFTRFVVVSLREAPRTGNDKTTIAFSLKDGHGRGALLRVLTVFDEEGINLTRIESRPSREKPWDYVFLAELEGHREDPNIARTMVRLGEKCPMLKHLGSYPRARKTKES
jgi:chorismate mutase/prephenate dehydratase